MRSPSVRPSLETAFVLLLIALGAAITVTSLHYGFGTPARPGPGFYPVAVGLLMFIFAGLLLAAVLSAPKAVGLDANGMRKLLLMGTIFVLWVAAMPVLGYALVTLTATFAFCKVMQLEGWKQPLLLSCGTGAFIYLLFDYWLHGDLPRGVFG